MHLQKCKVQEQAIKAFKKMCERLESAFSDSPSSKQANNGLSNKNESCRNKKRCCNNNNNNNNNNNREKNFYCLLHKNK